MSTKRSGLTTGGMMALVVIVVLLLVLLGGYTLIGALLDVLVILVLIGAVVWLVNAISRESRHL